MVVGCIFPLSPSWLAPGLEKRGEIAKFGSVEQINKLLEQRGLSEPAGGWAAYKRNVGPLYRQSLITENVMKNKLPFTIAATMAENLGIHPKCPTFLWRKKIKLSTEAGNGRGWAAGRGAPVFGINAVYQLPGILFPPLGSASP